MPPEFSDELWDKVRLDYHLSDMLTKEPVLGNTRNKPGFAETSLADGSEFGGLQAFWTSEGASLTPSKAQLQQIQYVLQKLTVLVYETNELLADDYKYDFSSVLQDKIAIVLRRKMNDAIVNGSGSGQPKGFVNEPSLITVTHDSGDSAPVKLSYPDIVNMYQRMYLPSQRSKNAVWIAHQAYQADLMNMAFPNASGT